MCVCCEGNSVMPKDLLAVLHEVMIIVSACFAPCCLQNIAED